MRTKLEKRFYFHFKLEKILNCQYSFSSHELSAPMSNMASETETWLS